MLIRELLQRHSFNNLSGTADIVIIDYLEVVKIRARQTFYDE